MNRTFTQGRRLGAASAPLLVLASLLLASCGSSSHKTTATTKTSTSPDSVHVGSLKIHVSSFSECLKKNGITQPIDKAGTSGDGSTGALPKGVSKSRYEQVLKKCGVSFSASGAIPRVSALRHVNRGAIESQLKKFAACMRENGVSFPEPRTSGHSPTFDTKAVDTSSKAFRAAESKCIADLRGAHHTTPPAATG
jgi:hypothetical protein